MSQMPGNQVGELNVKISGDSKPLSDALRQAEAETKQSAEKISKGAEGAGRGFESATRSAGKFQKAIAAMLGPVTAIIAAVLTLTRVLQHLITAFESGESRARKFMDTLSSDAGSANARLAQTSARVAELNSVIAENQANLFSRAMNFLSGNTTAQMKAELESLRELEANLFRTMHQQQKAQAEQASQERIQRLQREIQLANAALADTTGEETDRVQTEQAIADLRSRLTKEISQEERNAIIEMTGLLQSQHVMRKQQAIERRREEEQADADRARKQEAADSLRHAREMEADAERARRFQQAMESAAQSFGSALESSSNASMGRIEVSVENIARRVGQLLNGQAR